MEFVYPFELGTNPFELGTKRFLQDRVCYAPWACAYWRVHMVVPPHLDENISIDWDRITTENPPSSPMTTLTWIFG